MTNQPTLEFGRGWGANHFIESRGGHKFREHMSSEVNVSKQRNRIKRKGSTIGIESGP